MDLFLEVPVAYCPECDTLIEEEFEEIGAVIVCPECGVDLEVPSIEPVELDPALLEDEEDDYDYDEADDWEEGEDYDYDGYNGNGDKNRI
jgi:alpha-aminoadipate carrier protein LysW